ncbi:hypothetical protein AB0O31_24680 [Kitasatospora cineracea]|uniref:hypothetical protein n=1 Tax=Kitasatospora cineracea TaxID=88074 RepID=UPI003412FAC6
MIIEGARPGGASWWGVLVERAVARGPLVLLVVAVGAVLQLAAGVVVSGLVPVFWLLRLLSVAVATLLVSFEYGVALRLLAFRPGLGFALRVPLRQFGLMAGWSVLLSVPTLVDLGAAFRPELYFDLLRGPLRWPLLALGAFGGVLAAALPAAVFVAGGGLRAAWRLLSSGWATALRLCAIALFGCVAGLLVQQWSTEALWRSRSVAAAFAVDALAVPVHLLVLLMLFATYRRSPAAARPDEADGAGGSGGRPADGGPEDGGAAGAGSAYPPVDAAFGR